MIVESLDVRETCDTGRLFSKKVHLRRKTKHGEGQEDRAMALPDTLAASWPRANPNRE